MSLLSVSLARENLNIRKNSTSSDSLGLSKIENNLSNRKNSTMQTDQNLRKNSEKFLKNFQIEQIELISSSNGKKLLNNRQEKEHASPIFNTNNKKNNFITEKTMSSSLTTKEEIIGNKSTNMENNNNNNINLYAVNNRNDEMRTKRVSNIPIPISKINDITNNNNNNHDQQINRNLNQNLKNLKNTVIISNKFNQSIPGEISSQSIFFNNSLLTKSTASLNKSQEDEPRRDTMTDGTNAKGHKRSNSLVNLEETRPIFSKSLANKIANAKNYQSRTTKSLNTNSTSLKPIVSKNESLYKSNAFVKPNSKIPIPNIQQSNLNSSSSNSYKSDNGSSSSSKQNENLKLVLNTTTQNNNSNGKSTKLSAIPVNVNSNKIK
ncbi:unnamed protein product [Brachionus calyciflorus]|uniref:Uncharacterized protein n=1 Tax=Brachionus calyciflorus TaxID=104777 RepID=A0A813S6Z6_9BILA|nr:unnamed protein product [Brachionus calyciflorus]